MQNLKLYQALIIGISLILFLGCGSSSVIVNSWKDPSYKLGEEKFEKVLLTALTRNETARRSAEDKMNQKNDKLIQSYTVFPDYESVQDEKKVKEVIGLMGFDAIITLRLIDKKQKQTYVPGSNMGGYYGNHNSYWGGYYSPGYYQTDVNYLIECNVFSLKHDKLIWSGITSTTNPSNIDDMVNTVFYTVHNQMIKDGLIAKPNTTYKTK